MKYNYLDYFMTHNLESKNFKIYDCMINSDHLLLSVQICPKSKIAVRNNMQYNLNSFKKKI